MASWTKKALMLTSFPDRSTYLLAVGTNNQQTFSSLLRSHHMRILLQHSFRTQQHSVKGWSDMLPHQRIRQASLWSCFRQQFHFVTELLRGTNQRGPKSGRWNTTNTMAGLLRVYLCCMAVQRIMKWGQTTSMSKIFKFLLWWYIHIW
jgi:hypothetical protein